MTGFWHKTACFATRCFGVKRQWCVLYWWIWQDERQYQVGIWSGVWWRWVCLILHFCLGRFCMRLWNNRLFPLRKPASFVSWTHGLLSLLLRTLANHNGIIAKQSSIISCFHTLCCQGLILIDDWSGLCWMVCLVLGLILFSWFWIHKTRLSIGDLPIIWSVFITKERFRPIRIRNSWIWLFWR